MRDEKLNERLMRKKRMMREEGENRDDGINTDLRSGKFQPRRIMYSTLSSS